MFAGDLMQHMPQVRAAQKGNGRFDYSECFRYVKPLFEQADYAILNFETTLTPKTDYHGFPTFRSPGDRLDNLQTRSGTGEVADLGNSFQMDNERLSV